MEEYRAELGAIMSLLNDLFTRNQVSKFQIAEFIYWLTVKMNCDQDMIGVLKMVITLLENK